ncbi:hypothetical protein ACQY0O_007820 [Thecaphora frezii]
MISTTVTRGWIPTLGGIPFHRTVLFQILVVGIVSFSQPGIWNALSNLGAGGQQKPYLVNAANALTYGIMTFGCALAGGLCNRIGIKWTLVIGVCFYTPYASSLYCNNRFGTEWYVILAAGLCGVGASLFWASEAAIAVGYPSPDQRGKMVGIWMGLRNLAPLISGGISLSLNTKGTQAGKVNYNTYLALIGLQCIGLPTALLLSHPSKVIRPDGTRIPHLNRTETSIATEIRGIFSALKSPTITLLIPFFVVGMWGTTYQSNYLTVNFSVRARALASLLTAIVSLSADVTMGVVMDSKLMGKNQAQAATRMWFFLASFTTGLWIWQTVTEVHFTRNRTAVDWNDGPRFSNALAVYILWKFIYELQQNFVYWLVGTYPITDGSMPRRVGVLRSFESLGSTFAYVVGATHWAQLNQCILSFSLWIACILPTTLAIAKVPEHKLENQTVVDALPEKDEEKLDSQVSTLHHQQTPYQSTSDGVEEK